MTLFNTPKVITLKLIRLYQRTMSFDHGFLRFLYPNGYCRHYPSCSEYGYQAIAKYGLIKGGARTVARVFRCNPWSSGGVDYPL
jgi:uncharacterized protein